MTGEKSRSGRGLLRGPQLLIAASALILGSLAIATPASADPGPVDDGSLTWGIKQSFRSYIVGPIAHGHITLAGGATQAASNGVFTFPDASGTYNPTNGAVAAAFEGTVHFQGHETATGSGIYQLDMNVTDVRVNISGTTGTVVADIASKSLSAGSIVTYNDVEFAALNLTGITPAVSGDAVTFTGIPTTLTAAGVPAFADFYTEGTAIDPVSFTLELGEDEEPQPGTATQTITTEVLATGGITISVASNEVELPSPTLEGDALVSTGSISNVTVTDLRTANPGWNVSGQVSDFVSGADSFGAENLGWTPEVVSSTSGQTVTAGAAIEPGVGLDSPATLGSATAGNGRGTAVLTADLELELPTDTAPGEYTTTLTLTVI